MTFFKEIISLLINFLFLCFPGQFFPVALQGRGDILPPALLCILVSSLGFEGLLLAIPVLILQLLQLLQDSSRLVGGVDQHAQQLEPKAEFRFKISKNKRNTITGSTQNSQENSLLHKHEGKKTKDKHGSHPSLQIEDLQNFMFTHTHTQKVRVHVHTQTQSLEK